MSKYSQFFVIINKLDLKKEQVVSEFTNGRTESLSSLGEGEYNKLMRWLETYNAVPPGDEMRKKMIGIARSMQWGINAKHIIPRLDGWLLKQKFKKKLMQHTVAELGIVLTIFETKVYADYLRALNK